MADPGCPSIHFVKKSKPFCVCRCFFRVQPINIKILWGYNCFSNMIQPVNFYFHFLSLYKELADVFVAMEGQLLGDPLTCSPLLCQPWAHVKEMSGGDSTMIVGETPGGNFSTSWKSTRIFLRDGHVYLNFEWIFFACIEIGDWTNGRCPLPLSCVVIFTRRKWGWHLSRVPQETPPPPPPPPTTRMTTTRTKHGSIEYISVQNDMISNDLFLLINRYSMLTWRSRLIHDRVVSDILCPWKV